MSKEKFPQGEWIIESIGIEGSQAPVLRFSIICIPVKGEKFDLSDDAMRSNAALITAAPKMYEKLKEIQNLFYTFSFRLLRCNEKKNAEQWMKKSMEIQKLLAEARGEE